MSRVTGVVYSDLGLASSFMALDWVQLALYRSLGFMPFPATLNVRPKTPADAETWRRLRDEIPALPLAPAGDGFCNARLYPVEIRGAGDSAETLRAAILLPQVENYPDDKIEIVAPVRLKERLELCDGDDLTLEFL